MPDQNPYFDLVLRPNVALVSVVRRFVTEFYERFLCEPRGTMRVTSATHELLDNAVKHSSDGETRIRIDVTPGTPRVVLVRVSNRASDAHLARLRAQLARLTEVADARARSTSRHDVARGAGAGLGLARVHREGEMQLRCEVAGDGLITIEATASVCEPE